MTGISDDLAIPQAEAISSPANHESPSPIDLLRLFQEQKAYFSQLRNDLKHIIKSEASNTARQLEAFHQLHSLIGDIPNSLHGWPVSPDFGLHLVRKIRDDDYDLIIEFGSGVSTFLELKALEHKQIYSNRSPEIPQIIVFEHLEPYLQQTLEFVARSPLRPVVDISLRPLEPWQDESGSYSFYSGTEVIGKTIRALFSRKRLHGKPIQTAFPLKLLVVIDGPPGATCRWARYPALPIILAACEGVRVAIDVLMDDVSRFDENEMAAAWEATIQSRQIPYSRQNLDYEKGGLLLRIPSLGWNKEADLEDADEVPFPCQNIEQLIRERNILERECERRYSALQQSEQQALVIRQLLAEKKQNSLVESELRAQLADRNHAVTELEKELQLVRQQLNEQQNAPALAEKPPIDLDDELEKLRKINILLRLQMRQVQEELEHYVLLAKRKEIGTPSESMESQEIRQEPKPISEYKSTKDQDWATINENRTRLQSAETPQ